MYTATFMKIKMNVLISTKFKSNQKTTVLQTVDLGNVRDIVLS